MKNALFIFPHSHLGLWLLCQIQCVMHAPRSKGRQSILTQFIISFIDFSNFGLGGNVCHDTVHAIYFFLLTKQVMCSKSKAWIRQPANVSPPFLLKDALE